MAELHIKKQPFPATIYLIDGSVEPGTLFAGRQSATHSGPETVQDLMDDPSPLLPFNLRGERFQLIGKQGIAAIRAVAGARPEGFYEKAFATLRLQGGHTFDGQLLVEGGRGTRISDAVAADEWLRLETQAGFVWAHRNHLLRLETR